MSLTGEQAVVLLDLLAAATSGIDMTEVIDAIGEELARLVEFDRLSVVLPDPESDYIVSYAFTTDSPGDRLRLRFADTSAPRVMEGEAFALDLTESPHAAERALAERYGLRSAVYAPLVARERVVGFLAVSSQRAGSYADDDVAFLRDVGRHLGVVVEHAVLAELANEAAIRGERLRVATRFHDELIRALGELLYVVGDQHNDASKSLRRIIADAREVVWDLEPTELADVGLVAAVSDLARDVELKGTVVTVDLDGEQPGVMDRRCVSALLSVAGEALSNVIEHADANRSAVDLEFGPAEATLRIADDGRGFDGEAKPSGVGLSMAQRRVTMVGGSMEVRSATDVGTKVVAVVPYQPTEPSTLETEVPEARSTEDISVIVADHQEAVRRGLGAMIDTIAGLSTSGLAADAGELERLVHELEADVALIDLDLPGLSLETAASALEVGTQIVTVSPYDRNERIFRWLEAGARGHVVRDIERHDLARAIRTVHSGGSLLPPVTTRRLLDRLEGSPDRLTERELDVLREIATGASNKAIAQRLYIGAGTVKFHVANILRKLEAGNRTEAVAKARSQGLVR